MTEPIINGQLAIAIVTTFGGIITTYMTLKIRQLVINKAKDRAPRDRMETIFDGYENLIKQQQTDIDRKTCIITALEGIVERLQAELNETRHVLASAKNELVATQNQNTYLQSQLDSMKKEYNAVKPVDTRFENFS